MNEEETNEQEQKEIASLLKRSVAPVDAELKRDLWPQMLRRLDESSSSQSWFSVMFSTAALSSVPWFDWALLAALIIGICIFPNTIPIWLYHF
jgi:hypothetical protein